MWFSLISVGYMSYSNAPFLGPFLFLPLLSSLWFLVLFLSRLILVSWLLASSYPLIAASNRNVGVYDGAFEGVFCHPPSTEPLVQCVDRALCCVVFRSLRRTMTWIPPCLSTGWITWNKAAVFFLPVVVPTTSCVCVQVRRFIRSRSPGVSRQWLVTGILF